MKEIMLTQGKKALVDDEDYERVAKIKWYAVLSKPTFTYYARKSLNPGFLRMHRFVMNAPLNMEVDHIDGNGLNNQKNNLRIVTHEQNHWNRRKIKKKTSKYKGVCWDRFCKKWYVSIKKNKKKIYLGIFDKETDAANAYDSMARKLFGEFANFNF